MRVLISTLSILMLASSPAFAADVDKSDKKKSDEARVEEFIENMPDMNVIAALIGSGVDTVTRAKTGEDNCKNVQKGYVSLIKAGLGEEPEDYTPKTDYNSEFADILREAIQEDAKKKD